MRLMNGDSLNVTDFIDCFHVLFYNFRGFSHSLLLGLLSYPPVSQEIIKPIHHWSILCILLGKKLTTEGRVCQLGNALFVLFFGVRTGGLVWLVSWG